MDLKKMTSENLVVFDVDFSKKEDVINYLVDALDKEGALIDKKKFLRDVMDREKQSATGLQDGLAIPHGKSTGVKEAKFAVARLKKPITNWESVDPKNKVKLVFLLAIPEGDKGKTHLKLLSELSTRLVDPNYLSSLRSAKTPQEFLENLNKESKKEELKVIKKVSEEKLILAITACPIGIAHTYMSAEALEKAGKEAGVKVIVEKQGASGIEDKHTLENIKKADAIIIAADVVVSELERFAGKPFVKCKVAAPIKDAAKLIEKVLNKPEGIIAGEEFEVVIQPEDGKKKKHFGHEVMTHIMTGISYMIPVIVAGGLLMGIGRIGAMPFGVERIINNPNYFGQHPNIILRTLHELNRFGGLIFRFMLPIFTMYMAFSIAGRKGLAPGFIGGVLADAIPYRFGIWYFSAQGYFGPPWMAAETAEYVRRWPAQSGFFGAIALGLVAGYTANWLSKKIKLPKNLQSMGPTLIIPLGATLTVFIANLLFVQPIFGGLNQWLVDTFYALGESGTMLFVVAIAAATAFDLGGPVNKSAMVVSMIMWEMGVFSFVPFHLGIVVPPIGLGLATIIDKYVVGRRVFPEELQAVGPTAFTLGIISISEGAIPFALKNPLWVVPINVMGAVLAAIIATSLGAEHWYPLAAIWGWMTIDGIPAYFTGKIIGVSFIAFANIFIRLHLMKKAEARLNFASI